MTFFRRIFFPVRVLILTVEISYVVLLRAAETSIEIGKLVIDAIEEEI